MQTCDDFTRIPEMLGRLEGLCFPYRAPDLCTRQLEVSEKTGPTRSLLLKSAGYYETFNDHIESVG